AVVTNNAFIMGNGGLGIELTASGTVFNGTSLSTAGVIFGYQGVVIGGAGTVTNFGTITGTSPFASAILIGGGGSVFNATGRSITGGFTGIDFGVGGTGT